MVEGLQSAAPGLSVAAGGGERLAVGGGGKPFTEDAIAQLKGVCGVVSKRDVPVIWTMFQNSKSFDVYRNKLKSGMALWAQNNGAEIDQGVVFSTATLEELTSLWFNPGKVGVAQYELTEKGVSVLTCRAILLAEMERLPEREQAMMVMTGT